MRAAILLTMAAVGAILMFTIYLWVTIAQYMNQQLLGM